MPALMSYRGDSPSGMRIVVDRLPKKLRVYLRALGGILLFCRLWSRRSCETLLNVPFTSSIRSEAIELVLDFHVV